jgi:hypothetical protein
MINWNFYMIIQNADDVKTGYIPRADNKIFARLMDAENFFSAR